ncbi:c-type cytochrome biogenesis protein CcmI [Loktanella sp. IMCC34160]|uniref:c-type cytochrome biogenesis protein CcmI n=1 Tax=Loktanella sp. IMCC34160 TaxID=2510646 RepID=UPI00101D5E9A|nr:c-type cytochrome biogenesis protein CcmI [Loktanella sp. IMCC34160]RYG89806.1 c-type cytochrome biogenesis protein CcmI [Loktanella sp. IMCC34160]
MLFWILAVLLTLLTVSLLVLPMLRGGDGVEAADDPAAKDMAIYRDQLAEVERDLARGVLDEAEAERTRTEIARRLLAADKSTRSDGAEAPQGITRGTVAVTALLLAGGTLGLYAWLGAPGAVDVPHAARIAASAEMRENRPSQAELEEAALPLMPLINADEDYLAIVNQLREIVPTRPDDLQGWLLLVQHEAALGQFAAAARAQEQVVRIKGAGAEVEDYTVLLDLMVGATADHVSPEAEALIRQILDMDDRNITARYYLGLLYDKTDRPDIAFRLWRGVIEEGDADTFHVFQARQQIERTAWLAGVDYTLPPERGPSAEDVANAADMTDEDRQAMIEGMVAQLSDRLANEGGTPAEWARLINAHGVLGNTEQAAAIWAEAQQVFAASPEAVATIRAAAEAAGVAQ